MSTRQIGVDPAKSVFEVAVSAVPGQVRERRRLSRTAFGTYFAEQAPAEVLLEACGSAQHWGRQGYLQTRTARINAVRGHLREFGCPIPVGARHVLPAGTAAPADDTVPAFLRPALATVLEEIRALEAQAEAVRTELARLAEQMPAAQLLQTVPGIGVLTATALVAFVGDIHRFRSGRHVAAYLGLTPRERSSGTVRRLGATPKQGNSYLRMLLIHGARAALRAGTVTRQPDDLRVWATAVATRQGHNVAAVARAHKLARVCWRVWREGRLFERRDPPR
jgi:transposase